MESAFQVKNLIFPYWLELRGTVKLFSPSYIHTKVVEQHCTILHQFVLSNQPIAHLS